MRLRERVHRRLSGLLRRPVQDAFHSVWYHDANTWRTNTWLGVPCRKNPMDLWIYQEIIHDLRPGLIVETGTFKGGSALFFACMVDLVGIDGQVVTVEFNPQPDLPRHPRITYVHGSSTAPGSFDRIQTMAAEAESVLVVLDSDHSRDHVLAELRLYGNLVTPGSYVIVEDGVVNGHPLRRTHGPGPFEAVHDFLATDDRFVIDRNRERLMLSECPDGFLRRRDA